MLAVHYLRNTKMTQFMHQWSWRERVYSKEYFPDCLNCWKYTTKIFYTKISIATKLQQKVRSANLWLIYSSSVSAD